MATRVWEQRLPAWMIEAEYEKKMKSRAGKTLPAFFSSPVMIIN
jgi:hypothetical protein